MQLVISYLIVMGYSERSDCVNLLSFHFSLIISLVLSFTSESHPTQFLLFI